MTSKTMEKLNNYVQKKLVDFLNENFYSFPITHLFKIQKKQSKFLFTNIVEFKITTDDIENLYDYFYLLLLNKIPKYKFLVIKIFNKEFIIKLKERYLTHSFIFTSILLNKGLFINKIDRYIKIETSDKHIYIIPFDEIQKITISQSLENKNHVNLIFSLYGNPKEKIIVSLNFPQEKHMLDRFSDFIYRKIYSEYNFDNPITGFYLNIALQKNK